MKVLKLFLLTLLVGLVACSPGNEGNNVATATTALTATTAATPEMATPQDETNDLAETQWQLVSFGPMGAEQPVLEGSMLTLQFEANGEAGGQGGCNSFGTQYEVQSDSLSFGNITSTLMACADENLNEQEQSYLAALNSVGQFERTNDQLTIWYNEGQSALHFVALTPGTGITPSAEVEPTMPSDEASSLANTQWTLESFGPTGAEELVLGGSMLTLEFDAAAQVGGSGGCNSYGASYATQDNMLTFSQIVQTERACAETALNQQEQTFFQALMAANSFEQTGDSLTIFYDNGQNALQFVRATVEPDATPTQSSEVPGMVIYIRQLQMLDAQTGWAIGRGEGEQPDRLLMTSDGGQTWQDHTPPEASVETPDTIPAFYFTSAQTGWVSYPHFSQGDPTGFHIWSTSDGGQTWNSQSLDFTGVTMDHFLPSDMGFLDGQFGWMMAQLGVGMNHDYIAIYTSNDGGQSWQRVTDPDHNPDIQSCNKSGLVFTNPQNGWLAGNCPGLMPPLFLYHSSDGGMTWTQTNLPQAEGQPPEIAETLGDACGIPQIGTVAPNHLFLILRCSDFDEDIHETWLYTSPDDGQTWTSFLLPLPSAAFEFISREEGWLIGRDETEPAAAFSLYHTSDGGQTWQSLATIGQNHQLEFVDAQNGWVLAGSIVDPVLLHTTDGGNTWQEIQPVVMP